MAGTNKEVEAASLNGNNGYLEISSITPTLIGTECHQSRASDYARIIRKYEEMMLAFRNELLHASESHDDHSLPTATENGQA